MPAKVSRSGNTRSFREGDSDSTGSITGNIIGAKIGYSNIPSKYTETLEMRDVILRVADEMFKYGL